MTQALNVGTTVLTDRSSEVGVWFSDHPVRVLTRPFRTSGSVRPGGSFNCLHRAVRYRAQLHQKREELSWERGCTARVIATNRKTSFTGSPLSFLPSRMGRREGSCLEAAFDLKRTMSSYGEKLKTQPINAKTGTLRL